MTIKKHDELMAEIEVINKKIELLRSEERKFMIEVEDRFQKEIIQQELEKRKLNKELMEGIKLIFPKWLNFLNDKEHKQ
jgi:bifunctional N-acetylglucosamine-1-phosphate-uridyltransferase/glucosamine-1-phosphate-acetyltransferase GlmU-like protein